VISDSIYIPRPELEERILAAAKSRSRLVLHGQIGSGRFTVLSRVLSAEGFNVSTVDFSALFTASDIAAAFADIAGIPPDPAAFPSALKKLEATAGKAGKKVGLVLRNLDALSGNPEEGVIVGYLRSHLQGVHRVAVFFTVSDYEFARRHFFDIGGAFFKQAALLEVGRLTEAEVAAMTRAYLGKRAAPAIASLICDLGGRRPAPTEHVLLWLRLRNASIYSQEVVLTAARALVQNMAPTFQSRLSGLTFNQRAVLTAFARGHELKSSRVLARASGVPVNTLGTVCSALLKQGLIVEDGNLGPVFCDPLLRVYLAQL
jgi:hypothetical protein